jgi:hypothetical protein
VTGTPPLRTTRRRVLRAPAAAVAAGLVAAGCDLSGSSDPGAGTTSPSAPGGTPEPTTTPTTDPDEALVARVRTEVAGAAALVAAAGTGRPALARELAPLARLHRRPLQALPGAEAEAPPDQVRGDASAALRRVRAREAGLQTALAEAAVEASSGPLAALLASMSAAVAQRLAVAEAGG